MSSKPRRLRPASRSPRSGKNTPAPGPSPGRGLLLFVVAVVVAGAALVYAVTRPAKPGATATPRPVAATPAPPANGPRASFARTYNFGRAQADSLIDCRIAITNSGNAPLEITSVQPGCGCMKAGEWTRQIAPGQSGTIPIRLDSRQYTGNFAKSVFVTCNDPAQTNLMIEIQGYLQRALEITPPSLALNLNSESPSNQASVRLVSHLDTPLGVFNPRSSLANVELQLVTNQPGKEYQLLARTLPPLPTIRQVGQVTLSTTSPDMPLTNLNLFVNYQQVVEPIPFQLRLPATPPAAPATLNAWVRNNGTNPLAITEAKVNAPGVTVTHEDDPLNRGIALKVQLPAGFQPPAGTNLELTVTTTHPRHPVVRIPLVPTAPPPGAAPR
ncbi:MAG: hypothetical protein RJA22_192 [Verrucomicrobiota bacterium]